MTDRGRRGFAGLPATFALAAALVAPGSAPAQDAPPGDPPPPAQVRAPWLDRLVEEAVIEAFVLPSLDDDRQVVALDPRAKALFEAVLQDYRRLGARPGVETPAYHVISGVGDPAKTAVGTARLEGEGLATGQYLLLLGDGFDEAGEALLVVTWTEDGVLRRSRRIVEWRDPDWEVREIRGDPFD